MTNDDGGELVALDERRRALLAVRVGAAVLIVASWFALPTGDAHSLQLVVTVCAAYIAAELALSTGLVRLGIPAAPILGVTIMADAVWLAWATYGASGLTSPLRGLLVLQLIVVTLAGSFRLGIKLALFYVWMLLTAVTLQEQGIVDVLGGAQIVFGDEAYRRFVVELVLYLGVALATGAFAALSERELRRRRAELDQLEQLALRLEQQEEPEGVAAELLAGIEETCGVRAAIVVRRDGDELVAIAERGALQPGPERLDRSASPVIDAAASSRRSWLLRHGRHDDDGILDRFAPGEALAVVPMPTGLDGGEQVLIAARAGDIGVRLRRRTLRLLERAAAHAAILGRNAELLAEVRSLAVKDALTGIANRRHLDETLTRACAQVERGRGSLGLLMIDIDHFKQLNDSHGHQVGDEVLQQVARTLDCQLRAGDLVGRYGGEEFQVLLPGAEPHEIGLAAERLRTAVEQMASRVPVTVSIGGAWAPRHGVSAEILTARADAALYDAKRGGRNRVELAGDSLQEVLDVKAS